MRYNGSTRACLFRVFSWCFRGEQAVSPRVGGLVGGGEARRVRCSFCTTILAHTKGERVLCHGGEREARRVGGS
jgi:hypothetical protein